MGSDVVDEENNYIMPEALKSPNAIGKENCWLRISPQDGTCL